MDAYTAPAITELGSVSDFTQDKGLGGYDGTFFLPIHDVTGGGGVTS